MQARLKRGKEAVMYSVYESINYDSNLLVNAFVTPIESARFTGIMNMSFWVSCGAVSVYISSRRNAFLRREICF